MMKPAMNPMNVYLIQNSDAVMTPQRTASVLFGRPSSSTMDLSPKYSAIVKSGMHSSSALPPKLNSLVV